MNKKKGIIITILVVLLLLVVGVTYAFFTYENGIKSDIVTGQIYMNYEETSTISLTGVFPETKAQALARNDENGVFEFTITGRNTSKYPVYYEIDLLEGGVITGKTEQSTKILPEHVRIYLERDGEPLVDGMTFKDFNNRRIYVDTVPANQTSNIEHKYTLRMWIDENVTISDTDISADYTTSEWNDSYASLKVRVVGDFEEKKVPIYLYDKIESTLTLTDASADIDGTRYVTGDNNTSNYVWYSGKLWRIVSINGNDSIKLVTEGNITSLAWDTSSANTNYSTSQVRAWLNNEFLPTLKEEKPLLVNSVWDYTTYSSFPDKKLETTSFETEKVGLLNIYDYYKCGSSSSFLVNGYGWWTISPYYDNWRLWSVGPDGKTYTNSTNYPYGIRPSINLISDVTIGGGDGTKINPYVIEGDKESGKNDELLINRISGEYVNFNNTAYRIVGIEEVNGVQLTKITMADYDMNKNTLITELSYGADSNQIVYSSTYGIGLYLENWYQATSTSDTYATNYINDVYKAMIATANDDKVEWYTGPTSGVGFDYTKSKTGTSVSATIGLGYYGEMFSSHYGPGESFSTYVWLMTIGSNSSIFNVFSNGFVYTDSPTASYGVRPSMYLKTNVKIVSGNGQPNSPYEITYNS